MFLGRACALTLLGKPAFELEIPRLKGLLCAHLLALCCAGGTCLGARLAWRMLFGVLAAFRLAVLTPDKRDLRHRRKIR